MDQLGTLLVHENTEVNILAITESFLNDTYSDHEISLPGYKIIRRDRVGREGGGIVIYIDNNTAFLRRKEFEVDDIEVIWLEIKPSYSKSILLCLIYRPPNAKADWISSFHNMLNLPYSSCHDIVIIGDFNFNMLVGGNNAWKNTVCHFNLKQVVNQPTRVTETTISMIDHIYTTEERLVNDVTVPHIRISDHFPVYFSLKY